MSYYPLLHGEREEFDREGALIKACPCCDGRQPEDLNRGTRDHLRVLAAAARLFGEDLGGFAAFLEDMLLTY